MAAAILHSHRNTDANAAGDLQKARLKAEDVKILVPVEGSSAMCAPPGVVFIPRHILAKQEEHAAHSKLSNSMQQE